MQLYGSTIRVLEFFLSIKTSQLRALPVLQEQELIAVMVHMDEMYMWAKRVQISPRFATWMRCIVYNDFII